MTSRRILVTGASGFIGARLAERLLADGWEVHLLLRPGARHRVAAAPSAPLRLHVHDGSTADLIGIVKTAAPLAVCHLASLFLVQHAAQDVEPLVRSNVLFGTQLVEAMATNKVTLLLNTGTAWQHFEDGAYNPVCLYAALKQAFEAVLRFYTETGALKVITLKLFDTYGPGDERPKLLKLLRDAAQSGQQLSMSPGEQCIDLVYIDDVLDAYTMALARLMAGGGAAMEEFAVSSGAPVPLKKIAALYAAVSGRSLDIAWGGRPYRVREVMQPWTQGQPVPGWQPRVSLERGMALFAGSAF